MISQAVKDEVIARAGRLCERCRGAGDFRELGIHHIRLRQMGGTKHEYTAAELLLVCGRCHSEQHHLREGHAN